MSYKEDAIQEAKRAGVDPDLFLRLIQQESGFNPKARSPVGAYGLTQVMPDTARQPGFGVNPLKDIESTDEQLRFGADYLDAMLDRYGGNESRALAAYNWGAGNADKWDGTDMSSLPAETRGYINNILGGRPASMGEPVEAGLPLPEKEPEYADNWFGNVRRKQDTMRAGLGDKLGLDVDQMKGIGRGLGGLGQFIARGGFS